MAYKRQIDRLPIVPKDAKEFNVTCHYCIVGCGYKAYTWPTNKQGGASAGQNKFGVDLAKQQPANTAAWYSPSMYNIVRQNGEDVHIVIKPDKECVVNSGLGSVRGARMAEMSYSRARNTELQRLTDPMVWRYGQTQPTSWDDAFDLVARVTVAVINGMGEDGLFVSAFDHGGAGGGYENTWGTGKLYFGAMKVKNIRIHNRPAYNSEVHATRDMGVGELNNCYEDAELADTIVAVGTNALETQTNYFLNHWVPNLPGASIDKKRAEFGSEPIQPSRIIIVDPRRTVTVNACEVEAGKDRVMHLAINSGTDLALFNAWLTYIAEKGWTDKTFIAASTKDFDKAVAANKTSLEEAAQITGLTVDQIPAVSGMDCPAEDGRRTAADNVRLRKRSHLGQRQLPHQRGARERSAGDGKHRPSGRWLCPHGWSPGRLLTPVGCPCRPTGRLCRSTPDRRQRWCAPHLGLRPLQDDAQRIQDQTDI
jgi:arsenite oxidase large subunit